MIPTSFNPLGARSKKFITRWNVSAGETIYLPLVSTGTYNMFVEWGDGSSSTITDYSSNTHTYTNAGTHDIKISGTCSRWDFYHETTSKDSIIAVLNWGNVGFTTMLYTFQGCTNLTRVAGYAPNLSSYERTFQESGLQVISPTLFRLCVDTTNFGNCFLLSDLAAIPSGLFDSCVSAEKLTAAFWGTNIEAIPAGLIDHCPNITAIDHCFRECASLSGSSQQLWLNPANAANYTLIAPDYDSGVPNGNHCYYGCTGLSDYASIPTYWK